jgi:hypothetical protein
MEATKAIITVQGRKVQVSEQAIADINAVLAECPASKNNYGDSVPTLDCRMKLVPTLTIAVELTTPEGSKLIES